MKIKRWYLDEAASFNDEKLLFHYTANATMETVSNIGELLCKVRTEVLSPSFQLFHEICHKISFYFYTKK